jgi:UDP-N-acetylmuramoyl-L-alanyl-D-glutamate--2,6-diaminopimelate ligase
LRAVRQAAKRDVILLAGKGHEAYQEISGKRRPFLDADHAALALAARATMKGTM